MKSNCRNSICAIVLYYMKIPLIIIATVSAFFMISCSEKSSNDWNAYSAAVLLEDPSEITGTTGINEITEQLLSEISVKQLNHNYPTRLTQGHDGKIYVSDAIAGSVDIYDTALNLTGKINNLDHPLGVAVDQEGRIYVGNNGRDNIEVYSAKGIKINTIGSGAVKMPNDLALDQQDNLYAADSQGNTIKVYDSTGKWLRDIGGPGDGDGELLFPSSVCIAYSEGAGELYVADQGHASVQVFDLQGNFLRAYGSAVEEFSSDWEGKFVRIQSLAVDRHGRLHAADCYMNNIQILDADTGEYLGSYGNFGSNPGELNIPLDIFINLSGQVLTANSGNKRIEVINTIQ